MRADVRNPRQPPFSHRPMTLLKPFKKMFKGIKRPAPAVPAGERYYVIGDIHGRADLFRALVKAIEADEAKKPVDTSVIVLLGDLIDRGPDSAGVVKYARKLMKRRPVRMLVGNHEEMFLQSFQKPDVLRHFLKFGGRETLLSYGLTTKQYNSLDIDELFDKLPEIVPQKHRDFLEAGEEMIVVGDYVFVHAGIHPDRPVEEQKRHDMLWIRERFLDHRKPLSHVVVHGHTIFEDIEIGRSRIGIDTGAYKTGRLTALVLEGAKQRTIQATEAKGGDIGIEKGKLAA